MAQGGALARSAGARAWSNFDRLHRIFDPALQRHRAAERAWFEAKEVAAAEDEAAAARVPALREEYDLAFVLFNSVMEHHLGTGKSGSGDGEDEDE